MVAGRVSISARALERVVTAVAAAELRAPVKDVSIRLTDNAGLLAVDVVSPLRLPGLGSGVSGPGVLERCQRARVGIRERTLELTGCAVRSVTVRISRARILEESRVA